MSTNVNFSLGLPVKLPCGATLPNRLCKAAMTESLSVDGMPSQQLLKLYETWSSSGVGLIITGNVQVDRFHLERAGNVVLDRVLSDKERMLFREWARVAGGNGAKVWMQLSHAGRQTPANINPRPLAPSAVRCEVPGRFGDPVAIDAEGIETLIRRFADGARTARDCGFDGVQVHSAHGYLLSSFLNPRANQRTDEWGGSLENRARLLRRVVHAIRSAVGSDFPVSIKMNSADFQQGGFAFEESVCLAGWLQADGVDLLEITGGSYEQATFMGAPGGATQQKASTRQREAYFLDFAKAMLEGTTPPLMVTGGFRSAEAMLEAVKSGISVIGLARPLCAETDGPARLLSGTIDALARFETGIRSAVAGVEITASAPGQIHPAFVSVTWFYQQIRRLGKGLAPDLSLAPAAAFIAERQDDSDMAAAVVASLAEPNRSSAPETAAPGSEQKSVAARAT